MALDVLDVVGSNALRSSNVCMTEDDYKEYEQEKRSRLFHDESYVDEDASDCPDDIEDEGEKSIYRRETRKAIVGLFVQPKLIERLTNLLEIPHAQIFLGSVMVLHKFACTQSYNHVLIEIVAFAGRALEKVVENLQNQDEKICLACLSLLKQLATRQEGRDAMITSKIVLMLMPLVSGQGATASKTFTVAMNVLVGLCQDGVTENIGLALGGPPPRHALYNDLMAIVSAEGDSPTISVEHLLNLKVMKFVVNFLVRSEDTSLFFDLSNQHKQMGAFILHRIFLHKTCCQTMQIRPVLEYFAYTLQTTFTLFMEGHFGHSAREKLLFFGSIQGACRGMAQIATHAEKGGEQVMNVISTFNIYKELEELLGFPDVKLDDSYAPKIECADAAARLIGSISRMPISEGHPESDKESMISLKDDVSACVATLTRLIEQMAKPLMGIVHSCPSKNAVASASSALAKLCSTAETCDLLLDMGLAKIAAGLFPEKPSILEGAKGMKNIKEEIFDVQAKNKRDLEVDALVALDASAFTLVASMCRTAAGKHAVQTSGMLRRCVERFHLSSGVRGVDLVVRGEVSCVFARICNMHTIESGNAGSSNDYILNPNYNTVRMLVELVREGGNSLYYRRGRFWATAALAELCRDTMRAVPLVVKFGGAVEFSRIVKGYTRKAGTPEPLLRPALQGLLRIAKYPMATYIPSIVAQDMQQPLIALASNVKLQIEYSEIKDREPLGHFAKDVLYMMSAAPVHGDASLAADDEESAITGSGRHELTASLEGTVDEARDGKGEGEGEGEGEEETRDFEDERRVGGEEDGERRMSEETNMNITTDQKFPVFDGTYSTMGVDTMGSLAANLKDEEETRVTRLSQLSAEDPGFRNELKRRKEFYEMGSLYRLGRDGGGNRSVAEAGTKSSEGKKAMNGKRSKRGGGRKGRSREESTKTPTSKVVREIEKVKEMRGEESRHEDTQANAVAFDNPEDVEKDAFIMVSQAPDLISTRPKGLSPKHIVMNDDSGVDSGESPTGTSSMGITKNFFGGKSPAGVQTPSLTFPRSLPSSSMQRPSLPSPLLSQSGSVSGGRELVTFYRPRKSAGMFIDPTFVDNNPVTDSGIEKLGNNAGGVPRMLSEKSITLGKSLWEIETFSHTVDILGSKVKISGKRVAGPDKVLDQGGRTRKAVTFDNIHEASVKRELHKLANENGGCSGGA